MVVSPVKSPNYFIAEAPSNPLLNLPFKMREDSDTDSLTEDIRLELWMPEMQLSCSLALTVTGIWHDACQSVNTFLHIARMTRFQLSK